jgi:hypothetical protein
VVPSVTADEIASSAPAAWEARIAVRDALAPKLAAGWRLTGIDLPDRRYWLGRP